MCIRDRGQHGGYARARHATKIGKNCSISPLAVIAKENVIIGDNVVIEEFAVIRDNVTIGDNCVIHAGVKIGFNDFEYKKENGKLFTVAHYGGVILGEEVELHPNTCVNKALYPWDNTVIGDRCKIDMLVQVSHGAVSYTHLDVYKRQGLSSAGAAGSSRGMSICALRRREGAFCAG